MIRAQAAAPAGPVQLIWTWFSIGLTGTGGTARVTSTHTNMEQQDTLLTSNTCCVINPLLTTEYSSLVHCSAACALLTARHVVTLTGPPDTGQLVSPPGQRS